MHEKIKPCPSCKKDDAIALVRAPVAIPHFRYECIRCHYSTNICCTQKGARRSWNRRSIHKRHIKQEGYEEAATTICCGTRAGHCNGVIAIDRAAFNQGENAQYDPKISEDGISSTLTAKGPSAVCFNAHDCQSKRAFDPDGVSPTLASGGHTEGMNIVPSVLNQSTVRRLTPLECERLQGFPDNWTQIGELIGFEECEDELGEKWKIGIYEYIDSNGKKRKTSDSARYRALGNSIALPSWVWVLERLSYCCGADRTMASLFDGIGGFPLIWETLNGAGTCLWASEIEEFPIAVTKHHF